MSKVSIIMPVFNSEKYIVETISSVINQSYNEWELLIIDDCSTDRSIELIDSFLHDDRIRVETLACNRGQAFARNIGLKISTGRYITFLDSDDIWNNDFLESQISFLSRLKCGIVYSSFEKKNEDLTKSYGFYRIKKEVKYSDLLYDNELSCLTTVFDTNYVRMVLFNEQFKHEDHIYWMDLLRKNNVSAYGNDMVLGTYRIRSGSTSHNKARAAIWKWKIYRDYLQMNFVRASYYFMHYCINGVVKNANIYKEKINVG